MSAEAVYADRDDLALPPDPACQVVPVLTGVVTDPSSCPIEPAPGPEPWVAVDPEVAEEFVRLFHSENPTAGPA
ncbi:hypothetical protein ACFPEL_07170, partial [Actinomycetospora chibensis]